MQKITNVITSIRDLEEPKKTCAQCKFFRRIKYIDHGVEENAVSTQDFCQYPFMACPEDDELGKLNCLVRCDKFEYYDVVKKKEE